MGSFPTVLSSCIFSTQHWRSEDSKKNIDDSEERSREKKLNDERALMKGRKGEMKQRCRVRVR